MRMLLIGAATVATVAVFGSAIASAGPIDRRQHRQVHRIGRGVQSGALTRLEARRLLAAQAHIRAEIVVYRRSGGGLSPWERRDVHRDLNRASRNIWLQKHDRQTR